MSGGIDCSVVARLCHKAGVPVLLVLMPNGNSMNLAGDNKDAMELIYKDLDIYILTGYGTVELKEKVENAIKRNVHKLNPIAFFKK